MSKNFSRFVHLGKTCNFQILDRTLITKIQPEEPYLVISISTPGKDLDVEIPNHNNLLIDILRTRFYDLNEQVADYQLFTPKMAKEIWEFVLGNLDKAKLIIIHCDVGICRSPAIGAALSFALNQEDQWFFNTFAPNMLVYRIMLENYPGEIEIPDRSLSEIDPNEPLF